MLCADPAVLHLSAATKERGGEKKENFTINESGQDSVGHLREWITRVDGPLVAGIALGQGRHRGGKAVWTNVIAGVT